MPGIDIYTKLMLHCDGADASTTFLDREITPKTVTAVGTAQIDTAQSKFGGASGLFDGNSDYLTLLDSTDWYFGTENFTIDLWWRPNSTARAFFFGQNQSSSNFQFFYFDSNQLFFNAISGGATSYVIYFSVPFTPIVGTWYHIALVRNGNVWDIYINGIAGAKTLHAGAYASTLPNYSAVAIIGAMWSGYGWLNGWIDELRISKGIARWTSNFTPPTEAYGGDILTETINLSDSLKVIIPLTENNTVVDNLNTYRLPSVRNISADQRVSDGQVEISYEVYFNHFESGDNELDIKFQYWNGASWVDCTTTTGEGTISISPGIWNVKIGTWNAKLDIPETYYSNTKIRVLASYIV